MLERFEEFTFAIYEIQRCWNKIASEGMEAYGLKGSYVVYLLAMNRFPDGITASKLGAVCGRDKADVSRAVAVLESKGMLKKSSDGGNLYRAKLFLTESGALLTKEIAKKAEYAQKIAGAGLSPSDSEALYRSLKTIRTNLRELAKDGIPSENPAADEAVPGLVRLY